MDFAPPRGMRDFYPEDMVLRNRIFDAWRAAAVAHGFEHYDACVVESLELLKRKAGEEVENQVYAFQDKSGRDIALRAEMTPTLARMVAQRQGSLQFPLKWFCIAQCFRYERMTKGRKREHYQLNLDVRPTASASPPARSSRSCSRNSASTSGTTPAPSSRSTRRARCRARRSRRSCAARGSTTRPAARRST